MAQEKELNESPVNEGEGEKSTILKIKEKIRLARNMRTKRLILVLSLLAIFTVGFYFIFRVAGLDPFSDEAVAIDSQGFALILIFCAIYIVQACTLNLIPGTTTFFISVLAWELFDGVNHFWQAYFISILAVLLGSIALYCLGKYGGRKLLYWLFDKDSLEKRLDWFSRNGSKGVPWLFLIPLFPTDLLCLTCGAAKMKFWQFCLIVVVFRPIEIALLLLYRIVLSMGIIQEMSPWEQILIVNVLIINIILLVIYHKTLLNIFNKTFNRKRREEELLHLLLAQERTRQAEQALEEKKRLYGIEPDCTEFQTKLE